MLKAFKKHCNENRKATSIMDNNEDVKEKSELSKAAPESVESKPAASEPEIDPIFFKAYEEPITESLKTGALDLCEWNIDVNTLVGDVIPFLNTHPNITALSIANIYDINENRVGSEGAAELSEVDTLKELDIRGNNIGDAGALALASSKSLKILNISNNGITFNGLKKFADNKVLEKLHVNCNEIDKKDAKIFTNTTIQAIGVGRKINDLYEFNSCGKKLDRHQKESDFNASQDVTSISTLKKN